MGEPTAAQRADATLGDMTADLLNMGVFRLGATGKTVAPSLLVGTGAPPYWPLATPNLAPEVNACAAD